MGYKLIIKYIEPYLPMPSIASQTDQYLPLLHLQHNLTQLYYRLKHQHQLNSQQADRIQYLEFKIQALEGSLFTQQKLTSHQQEAINAKLLREVIELEERIGKESQEMTKVQNMEVTGRAENIVTQQSSELPYFGDTQKLEQFSLREISNFPLSLSSSLAKENMNSKTLKSKESTTVKGKNRGGGDKQNQEREKKEKERNALQKSYRVSQSENRRLRKQNEQYLMKIRKLERISTARSQIGMSKFSMETMDFDDNYFENLDI